jgi:hypothetical protein
MMQPRRTTCNGLSVTSERGSVYETSTRVAVVGRSTVYKLGLSTTLTRPGGIAVGEGKACGLRSPRHTTFTTTTTKEIMYTALTSPAAVEMPAGREIRRCVASRSRSPCQTSLRRAGRAAEVVGAGRPKSKNSVRLAPCFMPTPDPRSPYSDLDVDSARPRWPGLRFCLRYSSGLCRGHCRDTH